MDVPDLSLMMRGRPRPPVGWLVAVAAVGTYVIYGAFAAGFVMVAIMLAFHPPAH
jgi:hypothetical protein